MRITRSPKGSPFLQRPCRRLIRVTRGIIHRYLAWIFDYTSSKTGPHADPPITDRNSPDGARHGSTVLSVGGQEHVLSVGDGLSSHVSRLLARVHCHVSFPGHVTA